MGSASGGGTHGAVAVFHRILKTAELFEPWVKECPLSYTSPNAPSKRDVLGTILLSILSGHKHYAHITSIRADSVNPQLLGMSKVVSEDSVRRAFRQVEEGVCAKWKTHHLGRCNEPLLYEPWILDLDTTVKPLYGHQEGAKVGSILTSRSAFARLPRAFRGKLAVGFGRGGASGNPDGGGKPGRNI